MTQEIEEFSLGAGEVRTYLPNQHPGFPMFVERTPHQTAAEAGLSDLLKLWEAKKEFVNAQLSSRGAVLFRGFEVGTQEAFESFTSYVKPVLLNYIDGNSPRTKIGQSVYTSTEYPPEYFISLHNELSYSAQWPKRLFFCCVTPAAEGGETPLVDGRLLVKELPPEVIHDFRTRKVCYVRNLHGGKGFGPSWQKTFETDDRTQVEQYAKSNGMEFEWRPDGSLKLFNLGSGTATHPLTGEEVWFNQADQFHPSTHPEAVYKSMMALYKSREDRLPQNVTFGDGTPIPLEYLNTVRDTVRRQMIRFQWQSGDLLVVDNMLVMHGRMPFKGPRRVLVSMSA